MFNKTALVIISLCLCSLCFAAEGLPDPNDWFIQPLSWGFPEPYELQMSDTYVIWEGDFATYFYDGTGVYPLGRFGGSVSGDSLACPTDGGIRFIRGDVNEVIPFVQDHVYSTDVYENAVIWWAGGSYYEGGDIYYYWNEDPMQDVIFLASDAKTPKIGPGIIAWLGYDGNDFEVFILKDQVVQQLTNNTVDESDLQMSDDGQLAWMSWHPVDYIFGYVHYYDGQRTRQMTVGNTNSWLCGISEEGVLYVSDHHPDYYPAFQNVLLLHDGTDETLIAGGGMGTYFLGAIGGGSIAWIEFNELDQEYRVNFLKGQELISWSVPGPFHHDNQMIGVWGNRLSWTPDNDDLYFGEHLRRNCVNPPRMDTNGDCQVNLVDFVVFASEWLACGYADQNDCL